MLLCISSLVRSFVPGGSSKRLKDHLVRYIRPELMEKVKFDTIYMTLLRKAQGVLGVDLPHDEFFDHLTDQFIGGEKGKLGKEAEDLGARVVSIVRKKLGVTLDQALKLVHPGEHLSDTDRKDLEPILDDVGRLIYSTVYRIMLHDMDDWVDYWKSRGRETSMPEHEKRPEDIGFMDVEHAEELGKETGIEEVEDLPDEIDLDKDLMSEDWREGLIKDIIDLIGRRVSDEKKRRVYKVLLLDRIIGGKSQPEVSKDLGIPRQTLDTWESDLRGMLVPFLKAQGLGVAVKDLGEKEIEGIPDYKEVLEDQENKEDFRDYVNRQISDSPKFQTVKKIMMLLIDGKDAKGVATEIGQTPEAIYWTMRTRFKPMYESWYKEIMKKEASMNILSSMIRVMAKKIVRIGPKEEEGGEAAGPLETKSYEAIIRQGLDKGKFLVSVHFVSDYDIMDVLSGKKVVGKDEAHFGYKEFVGTFDVFRSFGKVERSVSYVYTCGLNDDGSFKGDGKSVMKLDDEKIVDTHELKKVLDDYVDREVRPKGVIPVEGKYQVRYINDKNDKIYNGIDDFTGKFPTGIGYPDPAHKQYTEKFNLREKVKLHGPRVTETMNIQRAKALLKSVELELKEELGKKEIMQDKKRIESLKKKVDELKVLVKKEYDESFKADLDEIEQMVKDEELLRSASMYVYSAVFPGPETEGGKEFVKLLRGYKIDRPRPEGWLDIKDMKVLARTLAASFDIWLDAQLKGIEKGLKKEDREEREEGLKGKVMGDKKRALGLFEAIIGDLRSRRDKFKKDFPSDYEAFSKSRDMAWVDKGTESLVESLKGDLAHKSEMIEKPKSVGMVEKEKYKGLVAFLRQLKNGMGGVADRFEAASLSPVGEIADIAQLKRQISDVSKEMSSLGKVLTEIRGEDVLSPEQQDKIKNMDKKVMDLIKDMIVLEKVKDGDILENIEKEMERAQRMIDDTDMYLGPLEELEKDPSKKKFLTDIQKDELKKLKLYRSIKESCENSIKVLMDFIGKLPGKAQDKDITGILNKEIESITKIHNALVKEVADIGHKDISDEEAKDMEALESELTKAMDHFKELSQKKESLVQVPALISAQVLKSYVAYFSELYNYMSGMVWFREMEEPRYAYYELVLAEGEIDQARLRSTIVEQVRSVQRYGLKARDQIKSALLKLKDLLKKFIGSFPVGVGVSKGERSYTPMIKYPGQIPAAPIKTADNGRSEKIRAQVFSGADMTMARKLIESLEKMDKEEAEIELKALQEVFSDAFDLGLPIDVVKDKAKKLGISNDQARVRIKRNEDIIAGTMIHDFINHWMGVKESYTTRPKKERSPLGNKPASEYDVMGGFVRRNIPGLLEKAPEKGAKLRIPEVRDVTGVMDGAFDKDPEEVRKFIKEEIQEWGGGGGGGGAGGKTRPKAVRVNPPSGAKEDVQERVLTLLKTKSPREIVLTLLATQAKKIRDHVKSLKEGEYTLQSDAIDGLVTLLKTIYGIIIGFVAEPSKLIDMPRANQPPLKGHPDFAIDSLKEAVTLFDKLFNVYQEINHYIKPDEIGLPFKNISEIRSKSKLMERHMPFGLIDWISYWQRIEGVGKELKDIKEKALEKKAFGIVSPSLTSLNVMSKFLKEASDIEMARAI